MVFHYRKLETDERGEHAEKIMIGQLSNSSASIQLKTGLVIP